MSSLVFSNNDFAFATSEKKTTDDIMATEPATSDMFFLIVSRYELINGPESWICYFVPPPRLIIFACVVESKSASFAWLGSTARTVHSRAFSMLSTTQAWCATAEELNFAVP
jgi:hypothetical protein